MAHGLQFKSQTDKQPWYNHGLDSVADLESFSSALMNPYQLPVLFRTPVSRVSALGSTTSEGQEKPSVGKEKMNS
jgi:hypothetical protein